MVEFFVDSKKFWRAKNWQIFWTGKITEERLKLFDRVRIKKDFQGWIGDFELRCVLDRESFTPDYNIEVWVNNQKIYSVSPRKQVLELFFTIEDMVDAVKIPFHVLPLYLNTGRDLLDILVRKRLEVCS